MMLNENKTNCSNGREWSEEMDTAMLCLDLCAALLNICLCVCSRRLLRESGDPVHLCILSMTLGDLVLTGLASPLEILHRKTGVWLSRGGCIVLHFANWLGLAVSALSLTLLNFDKLVYFSCPLRYERWMSLRGCLAAVLIIWVVCFGFVATVVISAHIGEQCVEFVVNNSGWYDVHTILFCVCPIVSSVLLSTYLFVITRRQRSVIDRQTNTEASTGLKLKSMVFIFATTAWTAVTLVPYRLFNLVRLHIHNPDECSESYWITSQAGWVLLYLLMSSPLVNPLITAFIYTPYRKLLIKPLRFWLRKTREFQSIDTLRTGDENENLFELKLFRGTAHSTATYV